MGKSNFTLTEKDEREIEGLLALGDKSLATKNVVLKSDSSESKLVGSVIGGTEGQRIISEGVEIKNIKPTSNVSSKVGKSVLGGVGAAAIVEGIGTGAAAVGTSSFVTGATATTLAAGAGLSIGAIALPVGIVAFLAGLLISSLFESDESKQKKKAANYCKELCDKMNKIIEKYNSDRKEYEAKYNKDQETIQRLLEKLAEYEAIFAAMKKKFDMLSAAFE